MNKNLRLLVIFSFILGLMGVGPNVRVNAEQGKNMPANAVVSAAKPLPIGSLLQTFNNEIKIVFSDIDGTLKPFNTDLSKRKLIPPSVNASIKKLRQHHIPTILVTGRTYGETKEIAESMDNGNTYMVLLQGTQIVDPKGKTIYKSGLKNDDVWKVLDAIEAFKKTHNLHSKIYAHVDGKPYAVEPYQLPYNWEPITVVKSFEELKGKTFHIIGVYETDPKALHEIQDYLKKEFPQYQINLSTKVYCDVCPADATKGTGVKKLAQILHYDLKNAAVFGDGENDVSMFDAVKQSGGAAVVVENGMDALKQHANYQTAPVAQDGFAKAVDVILKNNARLQHKRFNILQEMTH